MDHDPAAEGVTLRDLISCVHARSDDWEPTGCWAGARVAGALLPRRRPAGGGQSRPPRGRFEQGWGLEASRRHARASRGVNGVRGGPERRALRRWRACSAELAGEVSSGRFWGGILGAKDSWSACGAKASQCGPCAGLRSAAASSPRRTAAPAAAERRRSPFRPPRWSTSPRT